MSPEASIRKPDFFILGAPKCATTALAQWLADHHEVYFSPRKEPHFFNRDGIPGTGTLAEYEALFNGADTRHKAVGEGSTHYLYSRVAVRNILDYSPRARFIVCLRNPIEMVTALHNECLRQGWETVRGFEKAWRLQSQRRAGRRIPFTARRDPERLLYGPYCRLGEQLERLYGQVEHERVLPILVDDMRQDAAHEYRRVLDFLQLADDGRNSFPVINAAPQTRSVALSLAIRGTSLMRDALWLPKDWGFANAMRRLNTRRTTRTPLEAELKEELRSYFSEDVERLATLLDRDLSSWLE